MDSFHSNAVEMDIPGLKCVLELAVLDGDGAVVAEDFGRSRRILGNLDSRGCGSGAHGGGKDVKVVALAFDYRFDGYINRTGFDSDET